MGSKMFLICRSKFLSMMNHSVLLKATANKLRYLFVPFEIEIQDIVIAANGALESKSIWNMTAVLLKSMSHILST